MLTELTAACVMAIAAGLASPGTPDPGPRYVLDHEAETIEGEPIKLSEFEGRVVMFVNVASRCGLTPQYEQLQALYEEFYEQGFVVVGFPANNFMGQEPGSNEEILEFCTSRYQVEFPMMSKISVKGGDTHPLYEDLASQDKPIGGAPKWNFTKFLVNRKGEVVARFGSRTKPESDEVRAKIAELLSDKDLRDGIEPWTPPMNPSTGG